MVSFLCCVLVISIVYSYLGYYLYRWSKKSPSIYLLYVKFLCCNDLEKAEMPLALWKIHLLFAISNHDHIYIYIYAVMKVYFTILLLSSLCHFYTNLCMLPMYQKTPNYLMTAYHLLFRNIKICSWVLLGFCSSQRKLGVWNNIFFSRRRMTGKYPIFFLPTFEEWTKKTNRTSPLSHHITYYFLSGL